MQEQKNDEIPETFLSLSEIRELLDILYIINVLLKNNGNVTHTAKELDIGRRTLYDLMEKYNISCNYIPRKMEVELKSILEKCPDKPQRPSACRS
jgi:DNA-binding NtrC family response regulator